MVGTQSEVQKGKEQGAIALALQGQWERALEVNQGILQLFPDAVVSLRWARRSRFFLVMVL